VRILQEIVAYVMQTGPRGGKFYYTPAGKKVYRVLGGKTGEGRKLRQLKGQAYNDAWKSLGEFSRPATRPNGEAIGIALRGIFGDKAPDPKMLSDMFSDLGLEAKPYSIRKRADGTVAVSYDVKDINGKSVGDLSREFYKNDAGEPEVYHDFFTVEEAYQGGGRAAAVLGKSLKAYKQMGVKKVKVTAALDAGPYVWAKFGFNMTPDSFSQRTRQFEEFIRKLGVPKAIAGKIMSRVKDASSLAGIKIRMPNAEGKMETIHAGKDFLLYGRGGSSASWGGGFDLSDKKAMSRWRRQVAKGKEQRKAALASGTAALPLSQEELDRRKAKIEKKKEFYRSVANRSIPDT